MYLTVNGYNSYSYTGGKPFDAAKPTVVFIHGVINDHSVWILQSRYLAHHGWNVLAVDLPGHCKSEGEAPSSVEEGAAFVAALLDAAGVQRAALVGHSWGSLIALEAASQLKERVSHLVLVGTAFPMKVSAALLDAALNQPTKALEMVNIFSRSTLAPPPSALGPGTWVHGASMALGRRVLASNPEVNVFHRGFKACDSYANGETAITQITCPVLFVLGTQDQMTQAKAAKSLMDKAEASGKTVRVARVPVGHHQMTEAPEETLFAMRDFLNTP
ncbi:alpha/beta fold hydrolase [Polaromonas eurypsychrophila]|uniref:Alpha/beta hydrolase n=1 Tax=Polaromonas eurypsychrophila TaxID=1614635 RepID=A0A916SND5_9BURK|nr:alpha/beta hydrolase [Polaromonas eurypsychrophila]GGB07514.1 alpha/beta hydrolase [Polaromonas eurypsychrophila]